MYWSFLDELRLSVLAAPMFLVSNPDLAMMQCKAGIIGSFPALDAMSQDLLDSWSTEIEMRLISEVDTRAGHGTRQLAVNLVVHPTNVRLDADLETIVAHRVELFPTQVRTTRMDFDTATTWRKSWRTRDRRSWRAVGTY